MGYEKFLENFSLESWKDLAKSCIFVSKTVGSMLIALAVHFISNIWQLLKLLR